GRRAGTARPACAAPASDRDAATGLPALPWRARASAARRYAAASVRERKRDRRGSSRCASARRHGGDERNEGARPDRGRSAARDSVRAATRRMQEQQRRGQRAARQAVRGLADAARNNEALILNKELTHGSPTESQVPLEARHAPFA